ncbi:MAG: RraA family protein, partial [Diaphorobacter nitroreducens]
GATVNPGDLVVGDADGVVVIERAKAPAMLALAVKKVADEAARIEAIARGDTASKWLPAALRTAGVLKEGEEL